jgi:hypothetical protein
MTMAAAVVVVVLVAVVAAMKPPLRTLPSRAFVALPSSPHLLCCQRWTDFCDFHAGALHQLKNKTPNP